MHLKVLKEVGDVVYQATFKKSLISDQVLSDWKPKNITLTFKERKTEGTRVLLAGEYHIGLGISSCKRWLGTYNLRR